MSGDRGGRGGLIPGLVMIAVGTAFLLERFDFLSMRQVWRFWPMIVIAIGLGSLLRPEGGRRSVFLLLVGVWLQISVLELWGLDFGDSWPLLIIFVGASFIFDSLVVSARRGGGRGRPLEGHVGGASGFASGPADGNQDDADGFASGSADSDQGGAAAPEEDDHGV